MQIQLKQAEIVNALKQYITKQGIDLAGKDVTISFTAGRKDSGLSADISITDAGIPGLVGDGEEVVKPVLSVVKAVPASVEKVAEKVELAQAALMAVAVQTPPTPEKSEAAAKNLFS